MSNNFDPVVPDANNISTAAPTSENEQPKEPVAGGEGTIEPTPEAQKTPVRPQQRLMEISGADRLGKTKATCFLRSYLHYSDGTTKEVEEMQLNKPIVNIFASGGFVNVFLEFGRRTDEELNLAFDMITRYMSASNSAVFLPDEVAQGYFINEAGEDELVYYPILELAISPLGHEREYMIHGYRPLLYGMVGPTPTSDLTTLQIVFKDNLFIVDEHAGSIDYAAVERDAMEEARMESMGEFNPEDAQL